MSSEIGFVIMLAAAVAVLFWMMARKASLKISAQFARLAERFGLELTQPPATLAGFNRPEPFVHGHYLGREMSISVPGKGLQNTRQIETTLKLGVGEKDFGFQMTAGGLLGGMRQRDSKTKQRWTSGDAAFDAAVSVRTNDGARLTRLLDVSRRESILGFLKASKGTIYLSNGVLGFAKLGLIANDSQRELFEAVTEFFCALAESIETPGEE